MHFREMETQELQRLKNRYDIIGNDAALARALETAVAVAPTDLTVLINGESGVGKEVLPRIIHDHSRRSSGKYLVINCGGLPEGTINSELFGHVKGSFTGATETRRGYFEEADGGTLFLDEVGELPASTQTMLLRVLQNGEFMKVGSSKVERTDVRVIAATNVNLLYAVGQGKFREDLYYRLNAIQINMPALRERKDDIYLLFRKFAADFSDKYGVTKVSLDHGAIAALQAYRWPGNIRQLKNVAESISAMESEPLSSLSSHRQIDAPTLSNYLPKDDPAHLPAVTANGAGASSMSDSDRQMIIKALLDLKQQIDALNAAVFGDGSRGGALTAPEEPGTALEHFTPVQAHPAVPENDDAEWQEAEINASGREEETQEQSLSLQDAEAANIRKALLKHGGNRALAAKELGISERTLYRRLAKSGEAL